MKLKFADAGTGTSRDAKNAKPPLMPATGWILCRERKLN